MICYFPDLPGSAPISQTFPGQIGVAGTYFFIEVQFSLQWTDILF